MGELSERSESIPMIIGIAGGTGSGKSTFSRELILRIGTGRILHLSHDSYYSSKPTALIVVSIVSPF